MIRPILLLALACTFTGTAFAEEEHTKVATFEELMMVTPDVRTEYIWNVIDAVETFEEMAYARLGKDSAQLEIFRNKMQALKAMMPDAMADTSSSYSAAQRARATLNSDQQTYDDAFREYNEYMSPRNLEFNRNTASDLEDKLANARANLKDSRTAWRSVPDRERLGSSDNRNHREFDGKSCSYIKKHSNMAEVKKKYATHRGPRQCMYGGQFGDWSDGPASGNCIPHDCKDGKPNPNASSIQCSPLLVCKKNSEHMSLQDRAVCVKKSENAFLSCTSLFKEGRTKKGKVRDAKYDRDCVHPNNPEDVKEWAKYRDELKAMCNGPDSKNVERVLFCDECLELDARLETALASLGGRSRTSSGSRTNTTD